jgi:hypothetical protein
MLKPRLIALAALAAIALVAAPLQFAHQASAAPADRGEVIVTPPSGSEYGTFDFQGLVFVPGDHVQVYFEAPTGDVYQWIADNGADYVKVDSFASFDIDVELAQSLTDVPAGTWTAHFIPAESNEVDVTFYVQP